jgi:hypothetical protein
MWDLWWTKWHWVRFFSEFFGFSLSAPSLHSRLGGVGLPLDPRAAGSNLAEAIIFKGDKNPQRFG